MTDSSQRRQAYVAEVTPGVTPATPVWKVLRVTGGGLSNDDGFVTSDEVRADRNVGDVTLVSRDVSGELPFELSYGSMDDFIEAFMCGAWSSNVLKNGVVHKTFSYEITDELGSPDDYDRYTGVMVNTMKLDIPARQLITGSFGLVGNGVAIGTAIVAGATYTAPNTNPVMSGSNDVGTLTVNGSAGPKIMSMSLEGTNNIDLRPVVGSLYSNGLKKGRFEFKGSMNAYFDDIALRDLQRANNYVDVSIALGVGANKKYLVSMPKVKLTNAKKNTPGNNEDIMLTADFSVIYDATSTAAVTITRTP